MAPRPAWKGYLKLSLVTCAVELTNVVTHAEKVSFRILNRKTGNTVKRIYVDAQTRFPFRIEWWGSAKPGQTPALLLQMEFRDVVVNQAIASEVFSSVPSPQ